MHGAILGSWTSPFVPHALAVEIRSMWHTDLLEAWMDAVRAAELAKRLADAAAEVGDAAGPGVVAGCPDLAELADPRGRDCRGDGGACSSSGCGGAPLIPAPAVGLGARSAGLTHGPDRLGGTDRGPTAPGGARDGSDWRQPGSVTLTTRPALASRHFGPRFF
jgi:hypothetical protein